MAKTFGDYPLVSELEDDDIVPMMQNGQVKKVTVALISAKVQAGLSEEGRLYVNPSITQLTGGTEESLDSLFTIPLRFGSYILLTINGSGSIWQLENAQAGAKDVMPLDNEDARWRRILGL